MSEVAIRIAVESLELSRSKALTGEICFEVGEVYFPDQRWNDFVVVILNWWIKAVSRIKNSKNGVSEELLFMDGPYLVRACKTNQCLMHMEFIKRALDGEEVFLSVDCDINKFTESLVESAKRLLKEIENRKWEVRELEKLRVGVDSI